MNLKPWRIALAAVIILTAMAVIVEFRIGGRPVLDLPPGPAARTDGGPLPVLADGMPAFSGIAEWINSEELTTAELKGKVVLIDFWTYTCINCIRSLPHVVALDKQYRRSGLQIIGVHTPEFAFEREPANVRRAVTSFGIEYPVALDNNYSTWNNYGNRYWPSQYLFDAQGRLRYTSIGEGRHDETARAVQELLAEAGMGVEKEVVLPATKVDFSKIGTPETYLGYERQELLGNQDKLLRDRPQRFQAPAEVEFNRFYLDGVWSVEAERIVLTGSTGKISFRYQASNANLVMGAPDGVVRAEVRLDGLPVPEGSRGADLRQDDGKTYVYISDQRLYNLIDAGGEYAERLLEIVFPAAGVEAYAFTFG